MNIFLIRHGESVQNTGENNLLKMADHQIYLTEKGKDQARRSAEALKEYISGHPFLIKNERVWYSPYMRTTQTMKEFNKIMDFEEHGVDIREDIRLVEQQFGLFDSVPEELYGQCYPNEFACWERFRSQRGKFYARTPMGESPFDVAIRVKDFFGTIRRDYEKHDIDTLLIFTHGTTLRTFVMQYLHKSVDWYEKEKNPGSCWIRLIRDNQDFGYIYKE